MNLFGEPDSPRRDLWGGAGLLALSSFALGWTVSDLFSRPATSTDYISLLVWAAMVFISVSQFRAGLAAFGKWPEKNEDDQRGVNSSGV